MDTRKKKTIRATFDSLRVTHFVVALLALSGFWRAASAESEFTPTLGLGIAHTDNLTLAAVNTEDETVYTFEPSFVYTHTGKTTDVLIDYLMQGYRYSGRKETQVFHTYNATAGIDIVPQELFIDVGASRFQSIRDAREPIPARNLPLVGNRFDQDSYFITPSFQKQISSSITARGNYRHSWIVVDGGGNQLGQQDNQQGQAGFSVDNYIAGSGISWAMRYNWQRTDFDVAAPFEYQIAQLELGYWATRNVRLFASGGLESNVLVPLEPGLEEEVWEAGFSFSPSEEFNLLLAAGERSFGTSARAALNYVSRRGALNVTFVQQPTSQGNRQFILNGPSQRGLLQDVLTELGQTERFVSNRLNASWTYTLRKLSLEARAFIEDRTDITDAQGIVQPDREQRSLGFLANYRLGAKTSVSATVERFEFETGIDEEREILRASFGADYKLGARSTLEFLYSYSEQDADGAAIIGNQGVFDANVVSLMFRREF